MANLPKARPSVVEVSKANREKVKFRLTGVDASFANALRRVMISDVPTFAIDIVHIHANTSALNDEFLAHRLGLVPLVSESMDHFEFPRNCSCTGSCESCTVQFRLRVKNTDSNTLEVTSRDLKNISHQGAEVRPADADGPILLLKLKKNQEIDVTCNARKGTGKEHAKWSPVSTAVFRYGPEIILDPFKLEQVLLSQKQEFVASCPTKVYQLQGDSVEVARPSKCTFCEECVRKAESIITGSRTGRILLNPYDNFVRVNSLKDQFTFTVESTGALSAMNIVSVALKVLSEKLEDLKSIIPTLVDI
jgi:DNA-directed RNA polymerase II subunit RPB3